MDNKDVGSNMVGMDMGVGDTVIGMGGIGEDGVGAGGTRISVDGVAAWGAGKDSLSVVDVEVGVAALSTGGGVVGVDVLDKG